MQAVQNVSVEQSIIVGSQNLKQIVHCFHILIGDYSAVAESGYVVRIRARYCVELVHTCPLKGNGVSGIVAHVSVEDLHSEKSFGVHHRYTVSEWVSLIKQSLFGLYLFKIAEPSQIHITMLIEELLVKTVAEIIVGVGGGKSQFRTQKHLNSQLISPFFSLAIAL